MAHHFSRDWWSRLKSILYYTGQIGHYWPSLIYKLVNDHAALTKYSHTLSISHFFFYFQQQKHVSDFIFIASMKQVHLCSVSNNKPKEVGQVQLVWVSRGPFLLSQAVTLTDVQIASYLG